MRNIVMHAFLRSMGRWIFPLARNGWSKRGARTGLLAGGLLNCRDHGQWLVRARYCCIRCHMTTTFPICDCGEKNTCQCFLVVCKYFTFNNLGLIFQHIWQLFKSLAQTLIVHKQQHISKTFFLQYGFDLKLYNTIESRKEVHELLSTFFSRLVQFFLEFI